MECGGLTLLWTGWLDGPPSRTGGDESSLVVESGVKPPHSKTEPLQPWLSFYTHCTLR